MSATLRSLFEVTAVNGSNERRYKEILGCLDDIVPFIGAGMSIPIYPSWPGALLAMLMQIDFLDDFAKKSVHDLISTGKLDEAADELFAQAKQGQFYEALEETFSANQIDLGRVKRMPVALLPRAFGHCPVITTNFDRVLEKAVYVGDDAFDLVVRGPVEFRSDRSRLVRGRHHMLIKWHGCVTAPTNTVFTATDYARYYGQNINSDEALFIQEVFKSRPMLFIGCSLADDRTMKVLTQINKTESRPHYALIGQRADSAEQKAQGQRLSEAGVRPIWYPPGEHEYVRVLLQALADERSKAVGSVILSASSYIDRGRCIGQDSLVAELHDLLTGNPRGRAIEVHGGPGVGKSTICEEVARRLEYDGVTVRCVSLSKISTAIAALTSIVQVCDGNTTNPDIQQELDNLAEQNSGWLLYLDNTEDPQTDPRFTEWLLKFAAKAKWHVLYSTQTKIKHREVESRDVPTLDFASARKLFMRTWQEPIPNADEDAFATLLSETDCHPLSLALLAAQRDRWWNVPSLLAAWRKGHEFTLADETIRQRSLTAATKLAIDRIRDDGSTARLLAIMAHVPDRLPDRLVHLLPIKAAEKALNTLLKHCLIESSPWNNEPGFRMLSPIKREIPRLIPTSKLVAGERYLTITFCRVVDKTRPDPARPADAAEWNKASVALLPQILAFLRNLTDKKSTQRTVLARALDNHWQYMPAIAIDELDLLQAHGPYDCVTTAEFAEGRGKVCLFLNRLDDADMYYRQAAGLYDQVGDSLGQANALRRLGDLALRGDRLADADTHYRRAADLCEQIGARVGQANALLGLGDLALRENRLTDADTCYQRAADLYDKGGARVGHANALRGLGDLALRESKVADAETYYQHAATLYDQVGAKTGHANVLRGLGDLALRQGRLPDADIYYRRAADLYDQVGARLGQDGTSLRVADP